MRGGHNNNAWIKVARDDAWGKQGCRCAYCLSKISRAEVTADHVKPKSNGGTDAKNIAAACGFCNKAKGSIAPSLFKRMLSGGSPALNIDVQTVRAMRNINKRADAACKRIKGMWDVHSDTTGGL